MSISNVRLSTIALLLIGALYTMGCGKSPETTVTQGTPKPATAHHDHHDHDKKGDSNHKGHTGWWCDEHGIPEGVCSMCNSKVAAEFQKKGDWCTEHDRAKSQCFKCDPSLKEKFAAQYRAKEGKEPPAIEEETEAEGKKKS